MLSLREEIAFRAMLSLREDFVGGRCVSKEPGGSRGPFGEIEDGSAAKQRADIRKSESVAAKKLPEIIWKFEIWDLGFKLNFEL